VSPLQPNDALQQSVVIKGTVLKLTSTHVVVDIGAKSEGMLPLSRCSITRASQVPARRRNRRDARQGPHRGRLHQPLAPEGAALHAWDEIEKAYNDKKPIKAVVIDRIKGGLTVDILGARAFSARLAGGRASGPQSRR
jgi:small subunit ribosomal protein S1